MFLAVFIVILFSVSLCNGDTCYCKCCTGNFCTPTFQGTIPVSSCALSPCKSACQRKYLTQCTDGAGSHIYECRGGSVSTPNWIGVFNVANKCDTRTCCCPVGQLTLSRVSVDGLRVQCLFSGLQCPPGGLSLDETIEMPADFNTQIEFMGNIIQVTLSDDSRTIQLTNPVFPACSETVTRNGALSTCTMNLAFMFLLSSIMSFKQFMM